MAPVEAGAQQSPLTTTRNKLFEKASREVRAGRIRVQPRAPHVNAAE